jgi:hypothetical protein
MFAEATPVAATAYPLLNVFWTMLFFFVWILWLFLVVRVAIDIFRNDELSGVGKAAWMACVVFLPYLGVLFYLIAHGSTMQARDRGEPQPVDVPVSSTSHRRAAPRPNTADELSKLAALHDTGVLNDAEYASQKATVLSR